MVNTRYNDIKIVAPANAPIEGLAARDRGRGRSRGRVRERGHGRVAPAMEEVFIPNVPINGNPSVEKVEFENVEEVKNEKGLLEKRPPRCDSIVISPVKGSSFSSSVDWDVKTKALSIGSIHVASESNEVFPNDLPGMPPDRDIDFLIYLEPGTLPIQIPPYRMDPAELRELKTQI
ncbi:hypothetical protein EJD97_005883 [Solanum chilense]|uniref:Uncharacterized protein n=1 Tax=Solanum chilense TaxID=4083 RepID=A0A6N2BP21_SOLCI|nr:hypothetical protein EJD97_005883 [Solanum chilense]